jgi:sugar lactone lactonase YvrE
MIVISNDLYLAQQQAGIPPNYPLILWDSIIDIGNVSADSESETFPAINVANESTGQFWRSESINQQYFYVENLNIENADCIGIARHNFGSANIAYQLQGTNEDFDPGYQDVLFAAGKTGGSSTGLSSSIMPWILNNAAYESINISVASQDAISRGIFFKPDGTKMYVVGDFNNRVYQYSLSIPWVVSSASYDSVSFSVGSQEATPMFIFFKPDGTKMYVIGATQARVFQYSLSIPWDISSASYDSVNFLVTAQAGSPNGIFFKPDGTKMYVVADNDNTIYQYSLSSAWVVSSASYDSVSFSVGSQETQPRGIFFKPDGTKMYVVGENSDAVYQYSLPTPWVLTGATYDSISFSVASQDASPNGIFFKPDGTKMYVLGGTGSTDAVYQYSLATILTFNVSVNNGESQTTSSADFTAVPSTFADLLSELNAQTSDATWAIVGGNLRVSSDEGALFGSPVISDDSLLLELDDFDEIDDPVTGGETIAWDAITNEIMPADDTAIIHYFDTTSYQYYRLQLVPDATEPQIAHIKLGVALILPQKIYVGHRPITLNRRTDLVNNTSENGQFLGRIKIRGYLSTQVSMTHIMPDFYRASVDPFVLHAETGAFFFAWRPITYPTEVGYGWIDADISPENQSPNGMMEFSFNMKAVA